MAKRRMILAVPAITANYGLDRVGRAIARISRNLGFDVIEADGQSKPGNVSKEDVVIIFAPRVWQQWQDLKCHKVILNVHPTCPGNQYPPIYQTNFKRLKNATETCVEWIFEYNLHTTVWMKQEGMPAIFMPIGYDESFEFEKADPIGEPQAYFLGTMYQERKEWFERNRWVKTFNFIKCQWRRASLMNTDGVHLNTYIRKFRTFLSLRIITLLLANRRCVLTEPSDWTPLTNGEHYVVAKKKAFRRHVTELLADDKKRRELGECGYEFIRKNHRLDHAFEKALDEAGLL